MLKADNKIFLSWDDVNELVDTLCDKIPTELPNIDSVHGIARGGLIPAVLLSHKLDLPYVPTIGTNTLVVDDICDSGKTIKDAPGVYTGTLHYKASAISKPSVYAALLVNESQWIVYPWETNDSEMVQDYLK